MNQQPFNLYRLVNRGKPGIELLFWMASIVLLFFLNPGDVQTSLCLFRLVGFDHCPGCGLGHSMHNALHARFTQSFNEHVMGLPALLIILHRIIQLTHFKKTAIYEK